jgi:bifunctional DNA-binding transcriptional regulator/antitoxin component of YhaV-PrlF toxin-antitoxin module
MAQSALTTLSRWIVGTPTRYNEYKQSYNVRGAPRVPTSYVMKVSSNGQVSIPAEARARWQTDQVLVVDLGDHVALRPLPADPVGALRGKYRGRGPSVDRARRQARSGEAAREARK